MSQLQSFEFDVTYGFKYSSNCSLTITSIRDEDGYSYIEVRSEYGELMFHHYSFGEVVKFLYELLNTDKYAF